jgi:cysteine desulfurase/selenocysteine lyase
VNAPAPRPFDVAAARAEFPVLDQAVNDRPLVYLDNAASTQKPEAVIRAVADYYRHDHSNVHRGAHALADRATAAFEGARERVARFLSSPDGTAPVKREEIVWTRGTTEAINLVANAWGRTNLAEGDEIVLTELEHHANIVPWQQVAEVTGARIRVIPVTDAGELDLAAARGLIGERTRLVGVAHVSNSLGTVNPVTELVALAHEVGALALVDGAQAVNHFPVDVRGLGADFYVFSGHKLFGPTGIGVLYGREALLDAMPPWQGGGEMIETVSFETGPTWNRLPWKFEAGTPHIAGAIGLGAAIDWLASWDREAIAAHEAALLTRVDDALAGMNDVRRIGTAPGRTAVVSFLVEGAHPSDVGLLLDQQGVAVRTGHHCTMPLMTRYGVPGTVRASFSLYNTLEEADRFLEALEKVKTFL